MSSRKNLSCLLFLLLVYGGSLGVQLADGVFHLRDSSSQHTSDPHFEDPASESHGDRCVLSRPSATTQHVVLGGALLRAGCESRAPTVSANLARKTFRTLFLPLSRAPPVFG